MEKIIRIKKKKLVWTLIILSLIIPLAYGLFIWDNISYYSFENGSGTALTDIIGTNNGTLVNGAAFTRASKIGLYGLNVTTNQYASIPDSGDLDLTTGTLSIWVNRTDNGARYFITKGSEADADFNYLLRYDSATGFRGSIGNGVTSIAAVGGIVSIGNYHHVVFTWNSSRVELWVNGTLQQSTLNTITPLANTHPLFIGAINSSSGTTTNWTGSLDEFGIWNRVLSSQEIAQLYNNGAGTSPTQQNATTLAKVFNQTATESTRQYFSLSIAIPSTINLSSANFFWDNVEKPLQITSLNSTNYLLNSTFNLPLGTGIKLFYWNITYNDSSFDEIGDSQQVNEFILEYCNGDTNVPYINFTFRDELTDGNISAKIVSSTWDYYLEQETLSKGLIYSNNTEIPNYQFCFSPPEWPLNYEVSLQYSSSGYPQRTYAASGTLTNSTTNEVLYLLGANDGIYTNIQVVNVAGFPISGATVVAERQDGAEFILVEQSTTDSSGTVTLWVNPNANLRLTATASGYLQSQVIIRPTSTGYIMTLSSVEGNASFNSDLEGLSWRFEPNVGVIPLNQTMFNVTISAEKNNLLSCEFRLVNQTSNISSDTTGCASSGGNLSIVYTPGENEKIRGILYVDIGEGLFILDGDAYWIGYNQNISSWTTLKGILSSLSNLNEFGEGVEQEFSKIVFFFIALTIGLGLITFFSGYDLSNPGYTVSIVYGIIVFASLSGWFQFEGLVKSTLVGDTVAALLDKYIYLVIMTAFFMGWLFNMWGRNS